MTRAQVNKYPWIVSIAVPGFRHYCGGTLVAILLGFPTLTLMWLFNWFMYGDVCWQQLVQIVAGLEAIDPTYRVEPSPWMAGDGNTYTDYSHMMADFWQVQGQGGRRERNLLDRVIIYHILVLVVQTRRNFFYIVHEFEITTRKFFLLTIT